jgi:homoserine acetyltransferase
MKHKLETLDSVQLEKLLAKGITLKEIAEYYGTSLGGISEYTTQLFKNKKLNRPVEPKGCWMNSKERAAFKELRADEWLILKQTNLYKQLMNK